MGLVKSRIKSPYQEFLHTGIAPRLPVSLVLAVFDYGTMKFEDNMPPSKLEYILALMRGEA